MRPSQGTDPRSSPAITQRSSTIRPSDALATTTSLTAGWRSPASSASSVGSSIVTSSPLSARARPRSKSSLGTPARKPTRPKFTPSTGTFVPRNRFSARSIVPSPPRTIARSTSSPSVSSTPAWAASCSTLATASATVSGRPCATTAARSIDGMVDPVVEVRRKLGLRPVDKVEEELPVSLRAGEAGVSDTDGRRIPGEGGLGNLSEHRAVGVGLADDAALDVRAAGLELRLDEHDRLPARLGEPEHRRQHLTQRDEGDVAGDKLRPERELREVACVHALKHDHARVVAEALVELRPPDVERDHALGAALEEDVGEAARGGADVESQASRWIDVERVERVVELLAAAGDEARWLRELELHGIVDLLAGLLEAGNPSSHHERLGLRARVRETALD